MVYTIDMNIFYYLIAVPTLLTLTISLNSLGQTPDPSTTETPATEANADENDKPAIEPTPNTETRPKPARVHGNIKRATYPLNNNHNMEVITQYLPKASYQWIESENEPFLAIWHEDRTGNAKGAVLIVHAAGEYPSWPQTTAPLHESLPNYGWATMAISLPDPHLQTVPKRTLDVKKIPIKKVMESTNADGDEPLEADLAAEKVSTETTEVVATKAPKNNDDDDNAKEAKNLLEDIVVRKSTIEKRLVSSMKFLHDRGQFNIVLMGNGAGAIRTHTFIKNITPRISDKKLRKKLEKPIRASIIFNGRNRLPTDNEDYQEWFFDPDIPVLDIYTAGDSRNQEAAKIRKALGKNESVATHSQVKLTEMSYETSWGENRLSRRIRSFLDAYVQGIEVSNRRQKRTVK
ncbi:MAG: hypothetical protein ACI9NY_001494 [Kiritimatiellia bacterium]